MPVEWDEADVPEQGCGNPGSEGRNPIRFSDLAERTIVPTDLVCLLWHICITETTGSIFSIYAGLLNPLNDQEPAEVVRVRSFSVSLIDNFTRKKEAQTLLLFSFFISCR